MGTRLFDIFSFPEKAGNYERGATTKMPCTWRRWNPLKLHNLFQFLILACDPIGK